MNEINNNNTRGGLSKRTECLIFSRVCGWLVPFKQMNKGKRAEKNDQKYYKYNKVNE